MLYIMLAAAYPFGRPEDERLKPSRKMHVMLQVRLRLGCSCPAHILSTLRLHFFCLLKRCQHTAFTQILPRLSVSA